MNGICMYCGKTLTTGDNGFICRECEQSGNIKTEDSKIILSRYTPPPPTEEEVINALIKDTKIKTWYYDKKLDIFWSSESEESEEIGEFYHSCALKNSTRLTICKFFKWLNEAQNE